jgi:hypothetical protein
MNICNGYDNADGTVDGVNCFPPLFYFFLFVAVVA